MMKNVPETRLLVVNPNESLEVAFAQQLTIGRDVVNALTLNDSEVSRSHAILYRTENPENGETALNIKDLGAMNGVYINGEKVREAPLKSGDELILGRSIIIVDPDKNMDIEEMLTRRGRAVFKEIGSPKPFKVAQVTTFTLGELGDLAIREIQQMTNTGVWSARNGAYMMRALAELFEHEKAGDFFNQMLRVALEVVGGDRGVVMTAGEVDESLAIRALQSPGSDETIVISQNVIRIALKGDRAIFSPDVSIDERFPDYSKDKGAHEPHSLLSIPLQSGEKSCGFLYLDSLKETMSFNQGSLMLLSMFVRPAARIAEMRGFLGKRPQS